MKRWELIRGPRGLVLARPGARRLDVFATTVFPPLRAGALAHEVRKDLWRTLQDLRGFSPVVEITVGETELQVRAGGQVAAKSWPREATRDRIAALLSDSGKRARWIAHARLR